MERANTMTSKEQFLTFVGDLKEWNQIQEKGNKKNRSAWDKRMDFLGELEYILNNYGIKCNLDLDHKNTIELPVKDEWSNWEKDDIPYYFAIDEYPDLYQFLDKNEKLSESIVMLVPIIKEEK